MLHRQNRVEVVTELPVTTERHCLCKTKTKPLSQVCKKKNYIILFCRLDLGVFAANSHHILRVERSCCIMSNRYFVIDNKFQVRMITTDICCTARYSTCEESPGVIKCPGQKEDCRFCHLKLKNTFLF